MQMQYKHWCVVCNVGPVTVKWGMVSVLGWLSVGGFYKVVAISNQDDGSFFSFMATTNDVWIIPSFLIWDSITCCILCTFQVSSRLWPTWLRHIFSFLKSFSGFAGGKHYKEFTVPIFRLVLQNFAFCRLLSSYTLRNNCHFSLWVVIAVSVSMLVQGTKYFANRCKAAIFNDSSVSTFCLSFLFPFYPHSP